MNNKDKDLIRVADVQDAADISRIQVTTWQCAYQDILPAAYLQTLNVEERTKKWTEMIESPPTSHHQIFVYIQENQVTGFCTICPSRDKDADETIGELGAIYVDSQHLGKGIGSELIKKATNQLKKDFTTATLWVLRDNHLGRKFYERHGWQPDGTEKIEQRENTELLEIRYRKELS